MTEPQEPEDAGCVDDTDAVTEADELDEADEPEVEHINLGGES